MNTEAVIRKALDLWNEGKLEQYLACYDPDLEWEMPGARGRGVKGIPEALAAQMTALPDYRFEIRQIIATGDRAAVETTAIGNNTGTISLPDGSVRPATGKRVFRTMVLMMRVRNARIIEFREYSNEPSWDVQLTGSPALPASATSPSPS
jgi:ketosteroid isomerase-like protein